MEKLVEYFLKFGLTRQEGLIYHCLLTEGKLTGYEVSKHTGISRSNVYGALATLVEKGAAYLSEESSKKYTGVPIAEFCDNYIRNLEKAKEWMMINTPLKKVIEDGYITIEGDEHIINKVKNLIAKAEERVYISCSLKLLIKLEKELTLAIEAGKKIVILTDAKWFLQNTKVYIGENRGNQIGIITDSTYALTGEYGKNSMSTCLYSGQKNFVKLFKNALANEIRLIGLTKGEK